MVKPCKAKMTLKEAAERIGVSTATISNAYNRPDQLSTELREDILTQCEGFGYFGPNAAARSLRTGRTNIVGVVLSNYLSYSFSDAVANEFLQGLSSVFEPRDYNILIIPSRENDTKVFGVEAFVDGFIVYGPPADKKLESLNPHAKKMIAVDFEIEGCPSVNIDNFSAAKEVALHALKNNPTTVSIIGLRIIDSDRVCRVNEDEILELNKIITVPRLRGFLDAAASLNIDIPSERITHVPDNTYEHGYRAAREALMCSPRPKVLLCMSDRIALAAIRAAQDLNLSVPEDVSITGFDDISESKTHSIGLTTVHQQSIDKGRIAAEMFLGIREPSDVLLPTSLVVRESSR